MNDQMRNSFTSVAPPIVASPAKRIEALTGEAARQWLNGRDEALKAAAAALKTSPDDVPARVAQLAEALKKAERPNRVQLAALTRPAAANGAGPRSHISARTRKGIELIPLEHVIFFIADHKYVTLRHEGGEVLLDEPLKALEDEFGERFVRIHRNALVSRERIERLQRTPLGHFQLYLKGLGGDALTVSRRHVAGVRKLMNNL